MTTGSIALGTIRNGEVIPPCADTLAITRLWLERMPIMSPDERALAMEVITLLIHPPIFSLQR
jgi:hypothetical protein